MIVSYGGAQLDDSKVYYIKPADLYQEGSIACRDAPRGLVLRLISVAENGNEDAPMPFLSPNGWQQYFGSNWSDQRYGFKVLHGTGDLAGRAFSLTLAGLYNGTKPVYVEAYGDPVDPHAGYSNIYESRVGNCFLRMVLNRTPATYFSACAAGTASGKQAVMIRCYGDPDVVFWGCTAFTDFNDSRTPNPLREGTGITCAKNGKAVYSFTCNSRLVPTKMPLPNEPKPSGGADSAYYNSRATKFRFVFDEEGSSV